MTSLLPSNENLILFHLQMLQLEKNAKHSSIVSINHLPLQKKMFVSSNPQKPFLNPHSIQLRSMDFESSNSFGNREALRSRLANYKSDLTSLKTRIKNARAGSSDSRSDLLSSSNGGGYREPEQVLSGTDAHRQRLLNSTRRLEDSSASVSRSLAVAEETERIGTGILVNLGNQRQQIENVSAGLGDTRQNVQRSRKAITVLGRQVAFTKFILVMIVLGLIGVICVLIGFVALPPLITLIVELVKKKNGKN